MLIETITLNNFKSYAQAEILFTPGVNAIIGHNGAGKSSIQEAIGYVLFNCRGNGNERRLREGCNRGQVTVRFISSLDERRYEVERAFNATGTTRYRVLDPEAALIVAEGVDSTQTWLADHLRVEVGSDLASLFENTIGVPQGTFTAPFLLTAAQRKGVFDPLLQVDEYQKAADKLLATGRLLAKRSAALQADVARLEGMLHELPKYEQETRDLTMQFYSLSTKVTEGETSVGELQQTVAKFDEDEAEVERCEKELQVATSKLALSEQALITVTKQVEQAQTAANLVRENEGAYNEYLGLESIYRELRTKSAKRDEISAKLNQLMAKEAALQATLRERGRELDQVREAEVKALELEPKVKKQQEYEKALEELSDKRAYTLSDIARANKSIQATSSLGAICPVCASALTEEHKQEVLAADQAELAACKKMLDETDALIQKTKRELDALGNPRREQDIAKAACSRYKQLVDAFDALTGQANEQSVIIARGEKALAEYADLDETMTATETKRTELSKAYQLYVANQQLANQFDDLTSKRDELAARVASDRNAAHKAQQAFDLAYYGYAPKEHDRFRTALLMAQSDLASTRKELQLKSERLQTVQSQIAELRGCEADLAEKQAAHATTTQAHNTLELVRGWLKEAGPQITKRMVSRISQEASGIFGDIMDDHAAALQWSSDYELEMEVHGTRRAFRQLSGGEQMIAALALRLALLRHTSAIDIAFFDEPTAHLDAERRDNLAERIMQIRGFQQMFVISHDDTFERAAANYVRVSKDENGSSVSG